MQYQKDGEKHPPVLIAGYRSIEVSWKAVARK